MVLVQVIAIILLTQRPLILLKTYSFVRDERSICPRKV
jgi:hypothetical protein